MKIKVLKQHYYEGVLIYKGEELFCDKVHGSMMVRRGLAEEIKPKRKPRKKKEGGK
jgi:hypothetical protein